MITVVLVALVSVFELAAAVTAVAATPVRVLTVDVVLAQPASVDAVLTNIRNWLMGILAGLATVFLTIAAIRYVMADGDPGDVARAKAAFRSAGIGYAAAVLAPLILLALQQILGG